MTDIKICGLKTAEHVAAVARHGGTHTGFIFFERSPRHVEPDHAGELAALSRKALMVPVAVTVNANDDALHAIVTRMQPGMLQLHGSETPERVADVRARFGLPVMKAFAIRDRSDLAAAMPYAAVADRLLFDAKPPAGSDLPGGNGVRFDWSLLAGLELPVPWMLSGGLDPQNAAEALRIASPPGLDISSGVESAPGVKDVALIAAFFNAINAAHS